MQLEDLPVELLLKIFSYLPSNKNVSLVNKHFYGVICNSHEVGLSLGSYFFVSADFILFILHQSKTIILKQGKRNHMQMLESIRGTNRRISKLHIDFCKNDDAQIRTTISIIETFSETVKYLRLRAQTLEMLDFLEILLLLPNVEHLFLDSLDEIRFIPYRNIMMSSDDILNLHRLKTLHLLRGSEEFSVVFNRLPAGVLTELRVDDHNLDALTSLFKRQVNIKKLILNDSRLIQATLADDFFDQLKLESLSLLHCQYDRNLPRILSKQTKLKHLQLGKTTNFYGPLMKVFIDQLTELETVTIDVSKTPAAIIKGIDKLPKWKDLTLKSYTPLGSTLFIRKLATCVPNLKILRLHCLCSLNEIRSNFNFVEVLHKEEDHIQQTDAYNSEDNLFNPKLLDFSVHDALPFHEHPFLMQFIDNYPNLKILVLRSSEPLSNRHLKIILDGLTKLESLTVLGQSNITIDDLVWLTHHQNNLTFMSLTTLNVHTTDETKKQLSERFDEMKIDYVRLILAGRHGKVF